MIKIQLLNYSFNLINIITVHFNKITMLTNKLKNKFREKI